MGRGSRASALVRDDGRETLWAVEKRKKGAVGSRACLSGGTWGEVPGENSALLAGRILGAAIHRQHDHLGADVDARIEVGDILVGQADAAG